MAAHCPDAPKRYGPMAWVPLVKHGQTRPLDVPGRIQLSMLQAPNASGERGAGALLILTSMQAGP